MLTNSYQLAQDFWEYIPAMTITDCCYFPLCLSYWCCPVICEDRRKIWTDEKQRWEESEKRREEKKKEDQIKIKAEKVRRKKIQVRAKRYESHETLFFQCGSGWSRVGSLKRRVRSQLARWDMKIACRCGAKRMPKSKCTKHTKFGALFEVEMWKKCTRCRAKHISKSKCTKHTRFGALFEVEMSKKCTRCRAKHISKSKCTKHTRFEWQLRCRKSAPRCGTTRISKSKCSKHYMFGALLAVEMSKECTLPWRDARFQVEMYKTQHVRSTFGSSHFRCRKSARCCGVKHISESKCSKHYMFGLLLDVQMSFHAAGARDCAPCQKWAKCEGFLACP